MKTGGCLLGLREIKNKIFIKAFCNLLVIV